VKKLSSRLILLTFFIISSMTVFPVAAETVIIDFEDLPAGAQITTQYAGLTFSGETIVLEKPYYTYEDYPPVSGTKVLGSINGSIRIDFSIPVLGAGIWYTSTRSNGFLEAYDNQGNLVESTFGTANLGSTTHLQVNSTTNIAYIIVHDDGYYLTIDDLTYEKPDTNTSGEIIDTTFRPNPNGYQFYNNVSEEEISLWKKASWEIFREAYGPSLVDDNDLAKKYYDKKYSKCIGNGRCFGFSASSLVLYGDNFSTYNLILNDDAYWKSAPLFTTTVRDWIGYYQAKQYYSSVIKARSLKTGPTNVYSSIKDRMSNGSWINDPMVIDFWWWEDPYTDKNSNNKYDPGEYDGKGKMRIAGHTVVPYKIEESRDQSSAKVFVYDSNHPGENNIYFDFNFTQNTVSPLKDGDNDNEWVKSGASGYYDNYFRINARPIAAVRLSEIEQKPDEIPSFETISSTANLLYTDESGNHLGYFSGRFISEISGAYEVKVTGQNDFDDSAETYLIPEMNLKREIIGLDDYISTVTAFKGHSLAIANVKVSPGSVDELNIPKDGSSVEFISGKGTSTLSLLLERQETGISQIARVNTSQIEANGAVNLSNIDGNISIQNRGLPRTCSLYLEQIGSNPNSDDSIKNITIENNSIVYIKPSNWNNITNSEVKIEYDIGADGNVDSTEIIHQKDTTPPSTTTHLQSSYDITWINWTWTNPLDQDFNYTEVYLNGVFQTNTSAEYFNASGLQPETSYTLGTRTVDKDGNVNENWVNSTAITGKNIVPDIEKPVIQSVILFPANATSGSEINITVNATDNVEVSEVKADDVPLIKESNGLWRGNLTASSSNGDYSVLIKTNDISGNTAEASAPYHVVQLSGGASIAVSPKISSVTAGNNVSLTIKVKNAQSIDDTFKVWMSVSELPASSQANLTWFDWTEQQVKLRAGEEVTLSAKIDVPTGTAAGRKLFRVNVKSETIGISGFNTGYLTIS
jgi:hypothetical protein